MVAGEKEFQPGQYEGRNIWYGCAWIAMTAAANRKLLYMGRFQKTYGGIHSSFFTD